MHFRWLSAYLARLLLCAAIAAGAGCDTWAPNPTAPAPAPVVQPIAVRDGESSRLLLPNRLTSTKFAVIGDSGRGSAAQHEVAAQMVRFREMFPYPFVVMVGDNIYEGPASPEDYRRKFEEPYRKLLGDGVKFYAVLGNHDDPSQVDYAPFNMHGQRYYTFAPPEDVVAKIASKVEFFALDSTKLDRGQLRWLEERLSMSKAQWKIGVLHHPLYTSGRYRSTSRAHRWALEPLFLTYGVQLVFAGHEHIYQRSELQQGVLYFVTGGGGSLRLGDATPAPYIARSFDTDYHFMLVEIDGDEMYFQAISRAGETVDAGTMFLDAEEARHAGQARPSQDRAITPTGTAAPR